MACEMTLIWRIRAFLWGMLHPFATKQQRLERATRAMRKELYHAPSRAWADALRRIKAGTK